jgi:putative FmdB family regulatory protein
MPTYAFRCEKGHEFEQWRSIHAEALTNCPDDGCEVTPILGPVRSIGEQTREVNAVERQWDRDMPAYKRLRDSGIQPRGIDGADRLEATATNEFEFRYGDQARGLSDERIKEGIAEARDMVEGRA